MTNYRDKAPNKSVDFIILKKEIFRSFIFCMSNKYIFPVFLKKWFPEILPENIIIKKSSEYRTKSSDDSRDEWIDIASECRYPCWDHNEFGWYWNYRWLECHQYEDIEVPNSTKIVHERINERMHNFIVLLRGPDDYNLLVPYVLFTYFRYNHTNYHRVYSIFDDFYFILYIYWVVWEYNLEYYPWILDNSESFWIQNDYNLSLLFLVEFVVK